MMILQKQVPRSRDKSPAREVLVYTLPRRVTHTNYCPRAFVSEVLQSRPETAVTVNTFLRK